MHSANSTSDSIPTLLLMFHVADVITLLSNLPQSYKWYEENLFVYNRDNDLRAKKLCRYLH